MSVNKSRKWIPWALWLLVLVAGGSVLYQRYYRAPAIPPNSSEETGNPTDTGIRLVDVPWEHLPTVDRFVLTDQTGKVFDSAKLHGRPYVVSFFFATCPTFCRDLNGEIERVNRALRDVDIEFVTITVDPARDTTDVLARYAEGYQADPQRWHFLTGERNELVRAGEHNFNVPIDPATHTDNILLIDKWGRFRDRFKWDEPEDMQRFLSVAREVAAEQAPPLGRSIPTRNLMAGVNPPNLAAVPKLHDFHLTTLVGQPWFSRDLTGEVWLVHFPKVGCDACRDAVQRWLAADLPTEFQRPPLIGVSAEDPDQLDSWQQTIQVGQPSAEWILGTASEPYVGRVATDLFSMPRGDQAHEAPIWFLVDRWGQVQRRIDMSAFDEWQSLTDQINELRSQDVPGAPRSQPLPN